MSFGGGCPPREISRNWPRSVLPLAKDRDLRWTVGTGPRGFNRSFKGSAYRDADNVSSRIGGLEVGRERLLHPEYRLCTACADS
jgi:hypothetical protein